MIALATSLALLSGCKKNIQNDDAIKQGVTNYLSKRTDLLSMDVSVTSVQYQGDEATATVRFQAKGNSSPNAGMSMQYILERKENQWVVKGRAGGGEAHTGSSQAPPAQGTPGESGGSLGAMPNLPGSQPSMPAGHPSVGGDAGGSPTGTLPPGHPKIGDSQK